jgi:hypothetical protein
MDHKLQLAYQNPGTILETEIPDGYVKSMKKRQLYIKTLLQVDDKSRQGSSMPLPGKSRSCPKIEELYGHRQ